MRRGGKRLMVGPHGDSDYLSSGGILTPGSKRVPGDLSSVHGRGTAACSCLLDQLPVWSALGIPETAAWSLISRVHHELIYAWPALFATPHVNLFTTVPRRTFCAFGLHSPLDDNDHDDDLLFIESK